MQRDPEKPTHWVVVEPSLVAEFHTQNGQEKHSIAPKIGEDRDMPEQDEAESDDSDDSRQRKRKASVWNFQKCIDITLI